MYQEIIVVVFVVLFVERGRVDGWKDGGKGGTRQMSDVYYFMQKWYKTN